VRRALLRFLLFAAVALLTRAVLLGVTTVDLDEAVYLTAAREMLRGGVPYVDFADHKPPLVFAYYAAAQLLGDGMLPVRLLTTLLLVPFVAFCASAFFGHDRRGMAAGLLFLAWSAAFLGHDMLAVNCEVLMLGPLALAAVALGDAGAARRPSRALAAGLLVGVATLFKYQAAAWGPALAIAVVLAGWRDGKARLLGRLALLAGGFLLPPLAAWAVFARLGAGDAFVYWNWTHNLAYAANPVSLGETAERAAAYLLPFLLATLPLWWAAWRSRRALGDHAAALVAALLAFSALAALLGLRLYPHYLIPLYFPLALGAAPWAAEHVRRPLSHAARAFVAWAAVLLVGFTAANGYLYLVRDDVYTETHPAFARVAARLRQDPCFGEGPLFVWGWAPMFYTQTRLPAGSRFLLVGFSLVGYVSGNRDPRAGEGLVSPQHWDWLLDDLATRRPTYVLDTAAARLGRWGFPLEERPRLAAFVAASYEPLDVVDHVRLYRRRGCGAP
jgi:4-amino-4-deoxy-L-arabinose transferase-like glycosyltransferase